MLLYLMKLILTSVEFTRQVQWKPQILEKKGIPSNPLDPFKLLDKRGYLTGVKAK